MENGVWIHMEQHGKSDDIGNHQALFVYLMHLFRTSFHKLHPLKLTLQNLFHVISEFCMAKNIFKKTQRVYSVDSLPFSIERFFLDRKLEEISSRNGMNELIRSCFLLFRERKRIKTIDIAL